MALKILIVLALPMGLACASSSSQAQRQKAPALTQSLAPGGILQRSDNLRLSIRLDPETVEIGQTPAVITRFENVGPTDRYVNPHLVTGGRTIHARRAARNASRRRALHELSGLP